MWIRCGFNVNKIHEKFDRSEFNGLGYNSRNGIESLGIELEYLLFNAVANGLRLHEY